MYQPFLVTRFIKAVEQYYQPRPMVISTSDISQRVKLEASNDKRKFVIVQ